MPERIVGEWNRMSALNQAMEPARQGPQAHSLRDALHGLGISGLIHVAGLRLTEEEFHLRARDYQSQQVIAVHKRAHAQELGMIERHAFGVCPSVTRPLEEGPRELRQGFQVGEDTAPSR
jgi:hypothetical protein